VWWNRAVAITRADAEALDRADPLAPLRDQFVAAPTGVIALDGNSLGRPPATIAARLAALVDEWGHRRIDAWDDWMQLPFSVGDLLASEFLGAQAGEVVVCDSTTINLYKLAAAALAAAGPDRNVIVTDDDNFPTDRYVLAGLAANAGSEIRLVATDPVEGVDPDRIAAGLGPDVGLLSLSHVAYRSGALADMGAINAVARRAGVDVLWDLSHSVGAVPVDLDGTGTDLAVGCTYKYLCGGPGAPAFAYVRQARQAALRQPIWGWFSQRDQFAMGPAYEPVDGIGRIATGTPPVLGLVCVETAARLLASAGIDALRTKGLALGDLMVELAGEWLAPYGVILASPRSARRRGNHVALAHPQAESWCRLAAEQGVAGDFRAPDRLRLGPAPAATSFVDVWDALDRLRALAASSLT
jgi:kynureninase